MIATFKIGVPFKASLVVKKSDLKLTKGKKQYLALELFDGIDSINANIWDWNKPTKPEKNDIVDLEGSVTEWEGNKQLSISFIQPNKTLTLRAFAPSGGVDAEECYCKLFNLACSIGHDVLRRIVLDIITVHKQALLVAPGATSIHHAYVAGTLEHLVGTATKAKAIAEYIPEANVDLVTAGAILHDIGKVYTYRIDGVCVDMTNKGKSIEHISMGLIELEKYRDADNSGIVDLLQHIIASHHGKLEYGSPVTPQFLEAWLVHFADDIDAKANIIQGLNRKATGTFTEKSWPLENRAMFTQSYIHGFLADGYKEVELLELLAELHTEEEDN